MASTTPITEQTRISTGGFNKGILACMIGNALEWYDFVIYAYFAETLGRLFFPSHDIVAQRFYTWSIFWLGFIARPLGSIIFGYIGDRVSRKTALTTSIYVMAIPTALIGCLPTYHQVGHIAAVMLIILRTLQGLAIGGEFTGSMVFAVEHAPNSSRGFAGSWATFSLVVGIIIGSAVATGFSAWLGDAVMHDYGWRLPFLLSILGSLVGSYMRRSLTDPTVYLKDKVQKKAQATPLVDLFVRYKRLMLLVIGLDFLTAIGFFTLTVYMQNYSTTHLHLSNHLALTYNTLSMCVFGAFILLGGYLSDKFGRKLSLALPCIGFIVLAYPLFLWFPSAPLLAQVCLTIMMGLFFGVIPAALSEIFPTPVRFSGLSLSHNISMALFGGSLPLAADWLIEKTQSLASPAWLLIGAAAFSLFSVRFLKEGTNRDLPA